MRSLSSGAFLASVQVIEQPGRPGTLYVTHPSGITEDLFQAAPRVYWNVNEGDEPIVRGGHVHAAGGKQEYLVCIAGEIEIELHSEVGCDGWFPMSLRDEVVVVPSGVWHRFRLGPNAILLAVASTGFESGECIMERPCDCGG